MTRFIKPRTTESGRQLLLSYIQSSQQEILVRGGELYSGVWGHPDIEKALREKSGHVTLTFICGPYLDILDKEVIKLATESKLKLYRTDSRRGQHYRVFDDGKFFYFEDEHPVFGPDRKGLFVEEFDELGKDFKEDHHRLIESPNLVLTTQSNYLENFTYIAPNNGKGARTPTYDEIVHLVKYVEERIPDRDLVEKVIKRAEQGIQTIRPRKRVLTPLAHSR